jgi:hypothetical protein
MESLGFLWISGRLWDGGLGHKSGRGVNGDGIGLGRAMRLASDIASPVSLNYY